MVGCRECVREGQKAYGCVDRWITRWNNALFGAAGALDGVTSNPIGR